ncbi:phosphopantetheine-binding protein [Prosthecomicrobium hirschii]|jgi:acyl carrier protein|uniref:Acyl carrier protein n=1 Tax=Prosthecodimorpha hirschii TaxID=665126 RepID=A0A0P6W0A6_9HYPH|nr:phosphopantetheine-binding protein [Prosthecomicrobium hirschii]KPL51506.1 acyl carrier protein [Prosthecomicrobium hirschii]MCW1838590.1 phosphopantetheine-binding protein [Prosthecomicrobium hirschii]TPQ50203.1 acyl carrier protein [Prosthecomicrobium hirschii]
MSSRLTITNLIEEIAADHNKTLKPLSDDLVLLESGLDSLCFAILVARLEDKLGIDPFSASEEAYFPVTLGDFIRSYDHAVAA